MTYLKYFLAIPLFALIGQFYFYASTRQGGERQVACQSLGILYFTIGAAALISRDYLFASLGIISMMFGLRLLANGLDRLDKRVYIDRYEGEGTE